MVFYAACAVAGAVVPWYFNIRHMRESGELLTPQAWLADGFVSPPPFPRSESANLSRFRLSDAVLVPFVGRRRRKRGGGMSGLRRASWPPVPPAD